MSTIVREAHSPMAKHAPKHVFGIRHGEAWHNVLYPEIGDKAYVCFQDTSLTTKGMSQASSAHIPKPDLILVSPLMRTLQTADLLWPNARKVALECLQEYPQKTQLVNRRSAKSTLQNLFPHIDFSDLKTEQQRWPRHNPRQDKSTIKYVISTYSAQTIGIVTHSTWLKFCLTGSLDSEPELEHCKPYILEL